ncbi:cytochrome c peroxidase [Rubidibacter lacunae KORDI 51-2]|uniref:Cytochrome c peroxidase n=1 Tax=Rubidibacter lacunae KORDI 51-2 TaxID=582515 RepID=U5DNK1_9CHRO|nr:methanobactin export MATE transporter MbnM [Rubidibacter lacunae]ERN41285.1 cytochrome c peroxidase [Rubidibacter lacunae KORDI 51-2]
MRRRWWHWSLCCLLSTCLSVGFSHWLAADAADVGSPPAYTWHLPDWMPEPVVPANNPMTPEKVELGRHLFYEPRLSVNGEQSCATCHKQELAFTDGRPRAIGTTGEVHFRSSMSLANVAYNPVLTWANPLVTSLEAQALIPVFGEDPIEMGMAGKEQELLETLRGDREYADLFALAFPNADDPVTLQNVAFAIASFERTLISGNSAYDRFRYGGDNYAVSEAVKRGEALFNSERLECFHCHGGINYTDSVQHQDLEFTEVAFHNTGLYNIDGMGGYPPNNRGVFEISHDPEDMGRFKTPTLRNISLTAPYMHDGSVASLEEAIAHYASGGRAIVEGKYVGDGRSNPLKSNFMTGFELTEQEKQDLLALLESFTDREFLTNPAFGKPRSLESVEPDNLAD